MSNLVNRPELARRIAYNGGYTIGDMDDVLRLLEDVIEDALLAGEKVKLGKSLTLEMVELPAKKCWDQFNERYVKREAVYVVKPQLLKKLESIRIPAKEWEHERNEKDS
ncbi:putative histone family DNA-binding protein [Bacillus phage BPS10C]|uniref:Putative histone family DNA-binding protein n=1 Tax=Bacillus phage BPS10C TaxID=1277886 RepID=W5QUW6_9CAUD|nr:DNA binding protein [Bacillus phage BPS10C]AGI12197.1 putative histone family DNA-binding protein [Bacillus phage BPS10C]